MSSSFCIYLRNNVRVCTKKGTAFYGSRIMSGSGISTCSSGQEDSRKKLTLLLDIDSLNFIDSRDGSDTVHGFLKFVH